MRNFQAVGQPSPVIIALMLYKDLGLVLQPAKSTGVQDAVAVALKSRTGGAFRLMMASAMALQHLCGEGGGLIGRYEKGRN